MELSLVIPVWNDAEGLDRLLSQAAELGVFSQIIVADDASDTPLGPETVPSSLGLEDRITWLRSDRQRGAGHARNMALERVTGSHVIFFDSDDLFSMDFPRIVAAAAAEAEPFDFLIFRHDDSRIVETGGAGTFSTEENRWKSVGATEDFVRLTTAEAARLCQIPAYPWNKIYRTGFLRDHSIRCTETPVHNDLELHWTSFIVGRRILATTLTGAIHFWHPDGTRLTNRRGSDRLHVFQALENTLSRILSEPDMDRLTYLQPFFQFGFNLLGWIRENSEAEYHDALLDLSRRFSNSVIDKRVMTMIAYRDPALARKINRVLIEGALP